MKLPGFVLRKCNESLGNNSEQQRALAEFARLRRQFNQQKEIEPAFSPRELTKQTVDPNAQ
ncbi:MAG: hypothetical protein WAN76_18275 [Candidatus Sulfotelmatobacter sp.]